MSINQKTLRDVSKLCAEVQTLIREVEDQAKKDTEDFVTRVGGTSRWLVWPGRRTGELRRRSMDLTRALAELRRS